jgi:hypothetical protein
MRGTVGPPVGMAGALIGVTGDCLPPVQCSTFLPGPMLV